MSYIECLGVPCHSAADSGPLLPHSRTVRTSRRRFSLSALAALAAGVPVFRPGTSVPASAGPFVSAPTTGAAQGARGGRGALRRSLRASTAEGMFAEVVTACAGGAVLTGWALHLEAGPLTIALLGSLPFLSQWAQLPAAWLTATRGCRTVAIWSVGLSRQALLPLASLPFLPLAIEHKRLLLIAVATVSAVLGVVGNNAWVVWMGDLVPRRIRGRYFGRRTALCTLAGAAGMLAAGVLLDTARPRGWEPVALSTLALLACAAGVVTTVLMIRQHSPASSSIREGLCARVLLTPFADPAARRLLAYLVGWNAAVGLAAAFFAVHMLQSLRMGFALMALHGTGVALVRVVTAPAWGRAIDRLGGRPVLVACSFGIGAIPLLWVLASPELLWPILVADALLSGILWGGHGLAAFHLPLAVAPRKGRSWYLAVFAIAGGLAFAAASLSGGLLASLLPDPIWIGTHELGPYQQLFVLSSLARFTAAGLALRLLEPGARPLEELVRSVALPIRRLRLPGAWMRSP